MNSVDQTLSAKDTASMSTNRATVKLVDILLKTTMNAIPKLNKFNFYLTVYKHRLKYIGSEGDVFIASYPKSGTTWLQMIVHHIVSGSDEEISHINHVVPFLEQCLLMGPPVDQIKKPLKTHLSYRSIPKGPGKYIYVVRDGRDVAVSYYHHYRRYMMYRGDLEQFTNMFLDGKTVSGSWFQHVSEWIQNRSKLDLLIVRYEDLILDPEREIWKISEFLNKRINPQDMQTILTKCSFSYMKSNEHLFALETQRSISEDSGSFIRAGKAGEGAHIFSGETADRYAIEFKKHFGGSFAKQYAP